MCISQRTGNTVTGTPIIPAVLHYRNTAFDINAFNKRTETLVLNWA